MRVPQECDNRGKPAPQSISSECSRKARPRALDSCRATPTADRIRLVAAFSVAQPVTSKFAALMTGTTHASCPRHVLYELPSRGFAEITRPFFRLARHFDSGLRGLFIDRDDGRIDRCAIDCDFDLVAGFPSDRRSCGCFR